MKSILKLLENKFFLYVVIALIVFGFIQFTGWKNDQHKKQLSDYERQVNGQLSEKEREMQKMKTDLGIARSELVTQEELLNILKNEKEEVDKEFDKFRKKHNLMIKSRDRTIASLRQKLNGGTTDVVISDDCKGIEERCVISYNWEDHLKRFKLKDPNIFKSDNETFESEQIFKIYGEIYQEKNGSLQTRRLVLREMFKDKDGKYKPIPGAKADIIDSDFKYSTTPPVESWTWKDMFKLRGMFIGGLQVLPNPGYSVFGLGVEFFNLKNIGVASYTTMDFKNPSLMSQNLSIQYNPTINNVDLNIGFFASAGTPFVEIFDKYHFNTGLVFYINN